MAARLTALLLVALIALAGCGGDDDSAEPGAEVTAGPETNAAPGKSTGRMSKREKDGAGENGYEAKQKPAAKKPAPESAEEAVAQLSPSARIRALRKLLRPVLKTYGLSVRRATITLSDDRRTVTISVPASQACRASTTDPERFTGVVRDAFPFVNVVRVVVDGDQELADYAASNCNRKTLPPSGGGRVVFERSGYGNFDTKPVRIRSKRWVIEYAHQGDFFSVFVSKGGEYDPKVISDRRPSSARKSYKGPGTFKLNINGSGDWTVRVREL